MNPTTIYKITTADEWARAEAAGAFEGSAVDRRDGFIHFSTATQVAETAAKHFAGQRDLLLVEVDPSDLEIQWEPSRGGQLFPHLYGVLPLTAVRSVREIKDAGNLAQFPVRVPKRAKQPVAEGQ